MRQSWTAATRVLGDGARESARGRDFSRGTRLPAHRDAGSNANDRRSRSLALVLRHDIT
jgi:hypothetical protein